MDNSKIEQPDKKIEIQMIDDNQEEISDYLNIQLSNEEQREKYLSDIFLKRMVILSEDENYLHQIIEDDPEKLS